MMIEIFSRKLNGSRSPVLFISRSSAICSFLFWCHCCSRKGASSHCSSTAVHSAAFLRLAAAAILHWISFSWLLLQASAILHLAAFASCYNSTPDCNSAPNSNAANIYAPRQNRFCTFLSDEATRLPPPYEAGCFQNDDVSP